MNTSNFIAKGNRTTGSSRKNRSAPPDSDADISTSQPASKKACTTTSKTAKVAKPKKGPACATCRKKKIRCAHRLEFGSVTEQSSTVPSSTLANEQTKSATSINTSSSVPTKAASHSVSSKIPEPTETASPAAPKKFTKLDEDRNATPEFRKRIEQDRQKYTIQFTEEDWFREPKWASRVYKGWDSVDELLLHSKEPGNSSSAGNTPSLSFGDTISSGNSDVDIFQSFVKRGSQTYLSAPLNGPLASVLDGCLKVRDQEEDRRRTNSPIDLPRPQETTQDTRSTSGSGNLATSISDAEKEWLKKVESWKAEAYALVHDEKASCDD